MTQGLTFADDAEWGVPERRGSCTDVDEASTSKPLTASRVFRRSVSSMVDLVDDKGFKQPLVTENGMGSMG